MGRNKIFWLKYLLGFGIFVLCVIYLDSSSIVHAKIKSGICGENAKWEYNTKSQKLVISGKGAVNRKYKIGTQKDINIKTLIVKEGITSITRAVVPTDSAGNGFVKTKVKLPESLNTISACSFEGLLINKLYLSENIKNIENGAFFGILGLSDIAVASSNPYFCCKKRVLFTKDCKTLVHYVSSTRKKGTYSVPETVKIIKPLAFANSNVKKVILPRGLKKIGGGAFYCSRNLSKINISSLKKITEITDFDGRKQNIAADSYAVTSDADWNDNIMEEYESFKGKLLPEYFLGTFEGTSLDSFVMPSGLKYMGSESFRHCYFLKNLTLGKNFIGEINAEKQFHPRNLALFHVGLQKIKVAEGNRKYTTQNRILYSQDGKILYQTFFAPARKIEKLVIPKKVSQIAMGAFYNYKYPKSNINDIVIKGSLEKIGRYAFCGYTLRGTVTIEGAVKIIKSKAFAGTDFKEFYCKKGVLSIGKRAFYGSFAKVRLGNSVYTLQNVGEYAFDRPDLLETTYPLAIAKKGTVFRIVKVIAILLVCMG